MDWASEQDGWWDDGGCGHEVTLEEDVSLWGKVVAILVGAVGLIATLLGVARRWLHKDLDVRIISLERQLGEMKDHMASMESQLLDNTREAMQATAQVTLVAERLEEQGKQFEKQVDRIVVALNGVKGQVHALEQKVA